MDLSSRVPDDESMSIISDGQQQGDEGDDRQEYHVPAGDRTSAARSVSGYRATVTHGIGAMHMSWAWHQKVAMRNSTALTSMAAEKAQWHRQARNKISSWL